MCSLRLNVYFVSVPKLSDTMSWVGPINSNAQNLTPTFRRFPDVSEPSNLAVRHRESKISKS